MEEELQSPPIDVTTITSPPPATSTASFGDAFLKFHGVCLFPLWLKLQLIDWHFWYQIDNIIVLAPVILHVISSNIWIVQEHCVPKYLTFKTFQQALTKVVYGGVFYFFRLHHRRCLQVVSATRPVFRSLLRWWHLALNLILPPIWSSMSYPMVLTVSPDLVRTPTLSPQCQPNRNNKVCILYCFICQKFYSSADMWQLYENIFIEPFAVQS